VYLGILAVADTSVVTSGAYERYLLQNGVRYHHILDPATGYPVRNGVVSTTVVCTSSTTADALSTSLFVLGPAKGLALARSVPGVEAMVITEDRKIHLTAGLRPALTVTDPAYSVADE
jgi:FAD:protein FMN transferase